MAEESDLEKTEAASSRRLEQAREEGQVPRSREIGTFLVLMVGAAAFWLMGPWMVQRVSGFFRRGLVLDPSAYAKRIQREVPAWGAVIQREGITLD